MKRKRMDEMSCVLLSSSPDTLPHIPILHIHKMALNWAMVDATGERPVPLPEEKIFLAVEKCQMSLEFKNKAKWEAKGTAYMIPVLAGPYYEAGVIPVPGGNLPEGQAGGPTVKGLLKIWFLEGKGAAFRDAVEEVRNLSSGGQHGEQLPAYQPAQPGTPGSRSVAPSIAATADSSAGNLTAVGYATGPSSTRPQSRSSQLAPEDLEAARVAMAQEEEERETIRQQAERAADPSASGGVSGATPPRMDIDAGDDSRDGPPAYDVVGASPVTTFVPSSQRDGDQDMNNTPSQVSRAQRRAKARARRMKAAAVKALGSFEGRDRVLQLVHGLALLTHHSFGSVKNPRSFGLYPVPHLLFLPFPRRLRRDTLKGVHLAGEVVDKWRKLLLFSTWCAGAGLSVGQLIKGKQRANEDHEERDGADSPALTGWYATLAEVGELLMVCCDAAEVAAVLGGSSLIWRIARAGYASSGQKALNYRQRRGLERAAFVFASIGLALQLYTSSVYRRRARKALGRTHRRVLLLTDDLADAQRHHEEEEDGGSDNIPTLHRPTSVLESNIAISLRTTESHFQDIRRRISQASCEMMTYGSELVFAVYEVVLPAIEKESLEAWSEIGAGAFGLWRVFLE